MLLSGCTTVVDPNEPEIIRCVKYGNYRRVKEIVDSDQSLANFKRDDGVHLLYFAAANDNADIVSYLIDSGAEIDGSNALHIATRNECLPVVRLLVEAGADVDLPDEWQPPLHYTMLHKKAFVTEYLIDHAASVSATNYRGRTALHDCKSHEVARVLIDHGADVNAVDDSGDTPLHVAANPRQIVDRATITLLLEKGGDLSLTNNEGFTPRQLARRNEQHELLRVLDDLAR